MQAERSRHILHLYATKIIWTILHLKVSPDGTMEYCFMVCESMLVCIHIICSFFAVCVCVCVARFHRFFSVCVRCVLCLCVCGEVAPLYYFVCVCGCVCVCVCDEIPQLHLCVCGRPSR